MTHWKLRQPNFPEKPLIVDGITTNKYTPEKLKKIIKKNPKAIFNYSRKLIKHILEHPCDKDLPPEKY